MGDGVEQMGLAQAGVPVDEQGVIVHARPVGHGVGGSVGQLVAGAHYIGLKGERPGVLQVSRVVGFDAVIGGQLIVVEDLDLKIRGEQIPQGVPDIGQKPGLNGFLLEFVAAVQHESRILHSDHVHLVKPGVDGGGGQLL